MGKSLFRGSKTVGVPDQEAAARRRNRWDEIVNAERQHARELGYTVEHDDAHGPDHLLMWAQEYIYKGNLAAAADLIESARELLLRKAVADGR